MAFVHPLQCSVSNKAKTLVFVIIKSTILVFKHADGKFSLVGRWTDSMAGAENEKQIEGHISVKKLKGNEGQAVEKTESAVPGAAFSLQVRNLTLAPDESKLIACVDSDKSVVVFEIDERDTQNILKIVKRQPFPKRPNAIAVAEDNDTVVIADKFGDVHQFSMKESGLVKNEEMEPILGHVSMLTGITLAKNSEGQKYVITSDRDEHIKISHYPQCFIVDKWLFGHKEFVSSFCIPRWHPNWLCSAGGDDSVFAWDWENGKTLSQFNYREAIQPHLTDAHLAADRFQNEKKDVIEYAVSQILTCSTLPFVAFYVEATKLLFVLNICPKSGALSLKQIIHFPFNIVSVSESSDEFCVTLDTSDSDREEYVDYVCYNQRAKEFEVSTAKSEAFNKNLVSSLNGDELVRLDKNGLYPLYGIISLKKHGEHYS